MSELEILYHGEIQVLGWGESRNQGKYLKIRLWDVEQDPLEPFRGLDTDKKDKSLHILNATISKGDIIEQPKAEDWGKMATKLYSNGFFIAPPVLKAIGTDKQFREWIQKQPSAFSGEFSEFVDGEGRCEAAHVRRSNEAGTSYKPEYACIPLTHNEHHTQHTQGELELAEHDWWDKTKNRYVTTWAKESLLRIFSELAHQDYEGFRQVPPEILKHWCEENDLLPYLPSVYK